MYDRTEQRTPDQIDSPVGCYLQLVKTNKTNTVQVYQLQSGALSLVQIIQILCSHWLNFTILALCHNNNNTVVYLACLELCLYGIR